MAVAATVPEATVEVEMVPTEGERTPFIAEVDHERPAEIERAFESVEFVGEYRLVGEAQETQRYKIRPGVGLEAQLGGAVEDLDGLRALAITESIIDPIRVTPTGWVQSGRFADRSAFDEFRTFWQASENGDGFTLYRLARTDEAGYAGEGAAEGLTPRQREAVRIAHEKGYFDIPRKTSLDAVADELGISASSCSERLRRAQIHLVETHVDGAGRLRRLAESPPA